MLHKELLMMRENSRIGIYRPTGWPWNVGMDNANTTWWTNWVSEQRTSLSQSIRVDGVQNDCLYRGVHSSHRYAVTIFALNPYRDFEVTLEYEQIFHTIWHNSWCNISVTPIEIDKYCKGLYFLPSAGAGGGVVDVYQIAARIGGRGVLNYEVCMGIDKDSSKPVTGTSAYSYTANGKKYEFYAG